jgi:hypothetical protein
MRATVTVSAGLAGETASTAQTRTEDGVVGVNPSATHAVAGVLTTRDSASAGVITATNTDVTTGDKAVLTWAAANGDYKHRYNVECAVAEAAESGSSSSSEDADVIYDVTFSGGAGDDLPDEDSDVNIGLQIEANITFDFEDVDLFVVSTNVRGVVAFMDGTATEKCVVDMGTNGVALWMRDSGFPAPMSGTPVTKVLVGSGSILTTPATSAVFTPKILVLYDATDPGGSGQ